MLEKYLKQHTFARVRKTLKTKHVFW